MCKYKLKQEILVFRREKEKRKIVSVCAITHLLHPHSRLLQKDRLTEAFGSSRKQRAMESRLKNKVGTEALETSAAKALTHAANTPLLPLGKSQHPLPSFPVHQLT